MSCRIYSSFLLCCDTLDYMILMFPLECLVYKLFYGKQVAPNVPKDDVPKAKTHFYALQGEDLIRMRMIMMMVSSCLYVMV